MWHLKITAKPEAKEKLVIAIVAKKEVIKKYECGAKIFNIVVSKGRLH